MPFSPAIPKLMPGRMRNAEAERQCLHVDVPAGTTPDQVETPTWWGNYCRAARPKDIIEIFCDDGTWEARYRVLFVSQQEIRLGKIYYVDHDTPDIVEEKGFHLKWLSPSAKYALIAPNGEIVKDRLYPKPEAAKFMQQHMQNVGAS